MVNLSADHDKQPARPYKCPYPLCGRAFSRLEHQVPFSLPLGPPRLSFFRRDTFERIQAKNHSSAPIPLARSAFPARTNSPVTLVYTTMTILRVTLYIKQHLQNGPQKLRSIFQCRMTLLFLVFPVQETLVHLTIKRRLGQKKRQKVALTVMTRYIDVWFFISIRYTHIIIIRTNLMLVLQHMMVPSPDAVINPNPLHLPPSHQSPWTSSTSLNKKRPLEEQSTKLVVLKLFVVLNLASPKSLHQPSTPIHDTDCLKALQQVLS